jgi:hypothetical protein
MASGEYGPLAMNDIIAQIDSEITRLEEVKRLLSNASGFNGDSVASRRSATTKMTRRKKHTLSAEARKKIAEAQRKRWAAQKAKK